MIFETPNTVNSQLTLEYFEHYAKSHRTLVNDQDTAIEFIVNFSERALLQGNTHVYDDPYLITQLVSGAQGACFLHSEDLKSVVLEGIVGHLALDSLALVDNCTKVAILDAFYYHLNLAQNVIPDETYEFRGTGSQKSMERAHHIIDLLDLAIGSKLAIVGVVDDIVNSALEMGIQLKLADFARANTSISGIPILYDAQPIIHWADAVLITGNTLKTKTLHKLLPLAKTSAKTAVIYAMTGANIAPRYIQDGADIVVTETFPYYWYANTSSTMRVYLRRS